MTRPVKETRRERHEPTDHAVARGRDVSLRNEGRHSPDNHSGVVVDDALLVCTVELEWCWKPPTDRSGNDLSDQSSQSAEHVVVNYTSEEPEHLPRATDHEGRNAE